MELHFGLLAAAEADALLNRIGDEKEVAEQWEVTQKFLSKLGEATGLPHADTTKPDYLALLQGVTGTEDSSDVSSLAVPLTRTISIRTEPPACALGNLLCNDRCNAGLSDCGTWVPAPITYRTARKDRCQNISLIWIR